MKSVLKLLAVTAPLLGSCAALAADLPMRPAPAPVAAAVYSWTGMYVGVNGSYGWGSQDPIVLFSNRFDRTSFDLSGGTIGGTIGAQIQQGYVVLGVEADLGWASIEGSGRVIPAIAGVPGPLTLNVSTSIDAVGTARLRVGAAIGNLLLYGTTGAAFVRSTAAGTSIAGVPCGTVGVLVNCTGASWRPGLATGLGAEWAFTPNWSLKGEYLYIATLGTGASTDRINLVRGGVNYKF